MRVKFYLSAFKDREKELAEALRMGVVGAGDRFTMETTDRFQAADPALDMACVFALKGSARRILESYRAIGKRTLLIDKGLMRASTGLGGPPNFYRIALDEFMPLSRIERQMSECPSPDRWISLGMKFRTQRESDLDWPIIYCGSSQKYCDFHDLGDEREYAVSVINKIRDAAGNRPIMYRPKPSFLESRAIKGTTLSRTKHMDGDPSGSSYGTLGDLLPRAHAIVTHGSHAGIDSIIGGVPLITLGPCAARPVANHTIDSLRGDLFFPPKMTTFCWLSAITFWQWDCREMASGEMWRWLRKEMEIPA